MVDRQEHPRSALPIPDPTLLTTQAMEKSIAALKELQEEKITALSSLMMEKFRGVEQNFSGRDTALAAALLAQKTSVEELNKSNALSAAKSEAGFDKRIEGISTLMAAQNKGSDDKITDLKDRITAMEARGKGIADSYGWLIGLIGVLVGGGGLIAFFVK